MKKNIIKVSLLSLILLIISSIIIIVFGSTYTLKFDVNKSNYKLIVDKNNGDIKVLDVKEKNNNYFVKVKAKKEGKVYINLLDEEGVGQGKSIYIHKTKVITEDTFFGKSTCSEVIPISLSIILIYILSLIIKEYNKSKKENIFQYKNISLLGIIIFISFFIISNILSIFNYNGLYATINNTISSMSLVSIILFPLAFITFILVTISNIKLIIKEGKSIKNLLGLFLGIFICISTLLPDYIYKILMNSQKINIYNLNSISPYLYNFIETLVYLSISYLECILIGTIVIAIKAIKRKVEYNKDYIIILGCMIRKDGTLTPLLKGRVDSAIKFRNKQLESTGKDLIFIPSGGQGNNEIISEGEAIKNYLLEQGIKEDNILVEDKSKNTYENIYNSYKLINNDKSLVAFSTTNYHVLRAGLIATSQGLKLDGIGSKTKIYFWVNAFIREFIGTLYSERKKHIIVFLSIIVIIIIMIGITFLANNM